MKSFSQGLDAAKNKFLFDFLKVRAMFDERRSRAGIDKSYLLEPIAVETTTKTMITKRQVIGPAAKAARDQKMSNYSKVIVPPLQNRITNNHDINGNNHLSYASNETTATIDRTSFRANDTGMVNFNKKVAGNVSTTRRPTPAVSSVTTTSPPLKNVTNQKVNYM